MREVPGSNPGRALKTFIVIFYKCPVIHPFLLIIPNIHNYWNGVSARFNAPFGKVSELGIVEIAIYSPGTYISPICVSLCSDDGTGKPYETLDSMYITFETVPNSWDWFSVDFSAFNKEFTDGEAFHIVWTHISEFEDESFSLVDNGSGAHAGEERCNLLTDCHLHHTNKLLWLL